MTPTEAETCARSIVYAAAEICGLRENGARHYTATQRLAFAAQVFVCSGGIARNPIVSAVLGSHLAWSQADATEDGDATWRVFVRHTEIALRSYDEPKPTSRMIPDELLREIDAALRAADARIEFLTRNDNASVADEKTLRQIAAVIAKLENSAAAYVPDLIAIPAPKPLSVFNCEHPGYQDREDRARSAADRNG